VVWVQKWTKKQIANGRAREARRREKYYADPQNLPDAAKTPSTLQQGNKEKTNN
jgi:hypothetical protein